MEKIVNNLLNPSSLIGFIIGGLILSVLGAYLKDGINIILSSLSKRYKEWRIRQLAKEEEEIEFLSENSLVLNIVWTRIAVLVVVGVALVVVIFILDTRYMGGLTKNKLLSIVIYILSVFLIVGSYFLVSKINLLKRAFDRYEKKLKENRK